MFKQILLAYDGSDDSDYALELATELALASGAQLHLLGIVEVVAVVPLSPEFVMADIWTMEQDRLESTVAGAVQKLKDRGIAADGTIRQGSPAPEIVKAARERGCDLVVVGHRNKGIFTRWLEGSVSQGLLRQLPCSLLVAAREE